MSAEVENNKDEEKQEPTPPKRYFRATIVDIWQLGLKCLELIIAVCCLVLIYEPAQSTGMGTQYFHHMGIMFTAYSGSMVIIICLIFGRILKDKLGFRTAFVFSIANAVFFFTTGVLLTTDRAELTKHHYFHPSRYLLNMLTASIVLAFINGLVFVADAVITFIYKADF